MEKVKYYKNPERDKAETYIPYVPQYKLAEIEPTEYKSSLISTDPKKPTPKTVDIPKNRNIPYAEMVSPMSGNIPNVGNNIDQSWSSVDGQIIDDVFSEDYKTSPDHPMIDNNEFMSPQALGLPNETPVSYEEENTLMVNEDNIFNIIKELDNNAYLLLVYDTPICSGSKEEIEKQTMFLISGTHSICDGIPISMDNIVIVKKCQFEINVI